MFPDRASGPGTSTLTICGNPNLPAAARPRRQAKAWSRARRSWALV
jgi:hypothetical protein